MSLFDLILSQFNMLFEKCKKMKICVDKVNA